MVVTIHHTWTHKERQNERQADHPQGRLAMGGAICGGLLLLLIGDGIFRNPGTLDYDVLNTIQSLPLASLESILRATWTLGALPWTLLALGVVAAAFVVTRTWSLAVPALLAPAIVGMVYFVLGGLVSHHGLDADRVERTVGDPTRSSFPSGQVVSAVLLGGLLVAVCQRSRVLSIRFAGTAAAVIAIGLIGLADLWLGAHWPTEVLAAYAFGGMVLVFFVTLEYWFASAVDGLPLLAAASAAEDRFVAGEDRACAWLEQAVDRWKREGRLTEVEADGLEAEIEAPQFRAVLPHFGVFFGIGVALRFPFGSMARVGYILANEAVASARLLTRRIDRRGWLQAMGIHSPLVLLFAAMPGIGTFSYLASKPIWSNHLLFRVMLDSVLIKLPGNVYERVGLRSLIGRPTKTQITRSDSAAHSTLERRVSSRPNFLLTGWESADGVEYAHARVEATKRTPRSLVFDLPETQAVLKMLATVAIFLFGADLVMQTIDDRYQLMFIGWPQAVRIFDLGSEASLGTWFSVVGLFLCALLLSVIAYAARRRGEVFQRHWWLLALIVLGFSLDEQAKFHDAGGAGATSERIGSGFFYFGWVVPAIVCVMIVAIAYRRFIFALPARTRALALIAAVLYVGGEVGIEMVSGWLMDTRGHDLLYDTISSVEEFLGLVGIVFALGALLAYFQECIGELRIQIAGDEHDLVPDLAATRPLTLRSTVAAQRAVALPGVPTEIRDGYADSP